MVSGKDIIFDPYEYAFWCLVFNCKASDFESFRAYRKFKIDGLRRKERRNSKHEQ